MSQQDIKPKLSPDIIRTSGLNNLTQEQIKRAIYVYNISSKATLKNVADFFSFCGNVEKIVQDFDPSSNPNDIKQFAVVVFDNDTAYSTALLLGNAVIVDSPINVVPYTSVQTVHQVSQNTQSSNLREKPGRNAVDVISTLVSRGYITGEALIEEMKRKAKELDESMTISQRIELASKYTNEKISELDRNLGISSTLSSFTQKAVKVSADTYKNLDETLGINKALNEAKLGAVALGSSVKTGATELSKTVMEFEPVKDTVNLMSSAWSSFTSSFGYLRQTTNEKIEKEREMRNMKKETTKLEKKNEPQKIQENIPPTEPVTQTVPKEIVLNAPSQPTTQTSETQPETQQSEQQETQNPQ